MKIDETIKDLRETQEWIDKYAPEGKDGIEAGTLRAWGEYKKQLVDWLEELKCYKELEEQGRLVVLPEDAAFQIAAYDKNGEPIADTEDSVAIVNTVGQLFLITVLKHVRRGERREMAQDILDKTCRAIALFEEEEDEIH